MILRENQISDFNGNLFQFMDKLNPDLFIELYQQLLTFSFDSPEEQSTSISKYILSGTETVSIFNNFTSKALEIDSETKVLKDGSIRPGRILFPNNVSFPLDRKHQFLMYGKFYYLVGKSVKKLKLMKIKYLPDDFLRGLRDNPGEALYQKDTGSRFMYFIYRIRPSSIHSSETFNTFCDQLCEILL